MELYFHQYLKRIQVLINVKKNKIREKEITFKGGGKLSPEEKEKPSKMIINTNIH